MDKVRTQKCSNFVNLALAVLIFIFGAAFAYVQLAKPIADPDMFWHIKTGQYIVEHRSIPTVDVFSWFGRENSLKWHLQEWLFEVGIYTIWRTGGFTLVYVASSLMVGILAVLVFTLAFVRTRHIALSTLIGVLAVLGVAPFIAPRPQIATYALLTLTALFLQMRRWILALMAMILGLNIHGALYPIYLLIFALFTFPGSPLPLVLAGVSVFLQPLGWEVLRWPFGAFVGETAVIQEFFPTAIAKWPVLAVSLLSLIVLIRWEEVPIKEGLFALVLAALSMMALRHFPFYFILVIPILAPYLRILPFQKGSKPGLESKPRISFQEEMGWTRTLILLIIGITSAVLLVKASRVTTDVDEGYPRDALKFVTEQGIDRRIWNDWKDGGYLLFHGVPTFVDGRGDPFSNFWNAGVDLDREYMDTYRLKRDVRPFLRKYGITNLLTPKDTPLYRILEQSQDFTRIYNDPKYAIFRFDADKKESGGSVP